MFETSGNPEVVYLPEEQAAAFHHTMAQLLYILPRYRRYIHTTVAFLTTVVKKPDNDNWMKLNICLKYLKDTKYINLNISVCLLSIVKLWVDASYNTNDHYKRHTGATMTLGEGAVISMSNKTN